MILIMFYINKYYLAKIFKETYGSTINNYLIEKRITHAKQLLRFSSMTVEDVGSAVGMDGITYFSRMFKKIEGISPREYLKTVVKVWNNISCSILLKLDFRK